MTDPDDPYGDERLFAQFETMGVAEVTHMTNQWSGRMRGAAFKWLKLQAQEERSRTDASQAAQADSARSAKDAAEAAAEAARLAAREAAAANKILSPANMIAAAALLVAIISLAVSVMGGRH
jgi:hypothetical protein